MKSLTALLLGFALGLAYTSEAPCADAMTMLGNGLAAEKVTSISPSDLWHSLGENNYQSSDGLVVSFRPIDAESAYEKEGWVAIGLVLAGRGDVAEEPAAIKLWSRNELSFAKTEASSYQERHGKIALFFYPPECSDATKCKLVAAVFRLNGDTVLINSKPLGAIKAP